MFFINYFHSTIIFLCVQRFFFLAQLLLVYAFLVSLSQSLFLSRHVAVSVCFIFCQKKKDESSLLSFNNANLKLRIETANILCSVPLLLLLLLFEMVESHFLESLNEKCRQRWICLFIARCNGLIHNLASIEREREKNKIKRLVSIFFGTFSIFAVDIVLLLSFPPIFRFGCNSRS